MESKNKLTQQLELEEHLTLEANKQAEREDYTKRKQDKVRERREANTQNSREYKTNIPYIHTLKVKTDYPQKVQDNVKQG